jgi:hypothetical protein
MTADETLTEMWRDLRNDARHAPAVRVCINFAYDCDYLTLEQRELWLRRIATCPGHDDEGGRSWCSYCGDMPKEAAR